MNEISNPYFSPFYYCEGMNINLEESKFTKKSLERLKTLNPFKRNRRKNCTVCLKQHSDVSLLTFNIHTFSLNPFTHQKLVNKPK